jgi:dTDP-4-dehydrorhamnose reductase
MAKHIAILGSNGVIGKFLSSSLDYYTVTALSRAQLDLTNLQQVIDHFNNNYYDVVINCAANVDSRINAPLSVVSDNLLIFSNIYHVRNKLGRLIQFCSGAAFDRNHSINCAKENDIMVSQPRDSYGLSKNIISRICLTTSNFYTIRIFGVFYHTENKNRLLPKILSGERLTIQDKYFDYYIGNVNPKYKDINLVYPEKLLLSKFARLFCEIHNINQSHIKIVGTRIEEMHNYTGAAEKYNDLNLPVIGIKDGMKKYK